MIANLFFFMAGACAGGMAAVVACAVLFWTRLREPAEVKAIRAALAAAKDSEAVVAARKRIMEALGYDASAEDTPS